MIKLKDITLRRGTKVILQQANLTLNTNEKIGLVGRNGAGKSTLFALLRNELQADQGDLEIPQNWLIAKVAQEMPQTEQRATDFVIDGDPILVQAQQKLAQAEQMGNGEAIAEAHLLIGQAGGYDARSRAQTMLLGLGFKLNELEKPVSSFSGGWRMRLQLARALMCPAELMLLDEPTNHLDLDALVWLEAWLKKYTGTLIIISHDREFLDAITQVTVHLEDQQLTRYSGNYTAFEEQRAQRILLQQAAFDKQQDKIAHLQKFIDRFKAKATKAKQAQSRVKALERMERIEPVITASSFEFAFKETGHLPNPMLVLDDIACGYDQHAIVSHIKCSLLAGQRIGILGANGQGKSTVVKTIAQQIKPLSGVYTQGKGLRIGYFAQRELDILHEEETPLQHMQALAREFAPQTREQDLRGFLGGFRFIDDMVNQAVGTMSGGEKARLVLAMLVWQKPNLLLLDEPTNHLDLVTREALAMALNEFEGSVMLVSHDRAMLRSVCDEFWLVAQGALQPFDGDIDDYQQYLLDFSKAQREALKACASKEDTGTETIQSPFEATPKEKPLSREQRKLATQQRQHIQEKTRPLKKETALLEQRMADIDKETATLHAQLATGNPNAEKIAQMGKQLKQLQDEKEQAEERWLNLAEQIEAIVNNALN